MTDIALAPGVAKASKRGRKAGTKVPSVPWTTAEEAQLHSLVHAWSPIEPKKALWLTAAKELGTHRTPASCEQHFYYVERQQRAQVQSSTPVTGGGAAPKPKVSARMPRTPGEKEKKPKVRGRAAKRPSKAKEAQEADDGAIDSNGKLSIAASWPKPTAGLKEAGDGSDSDGLLGVVRNTRFGPWGFFLGCPTCGEQDFTERGSVAGSGRSAPPSGGSAYAFLPCHDVCPQALFETSNPNPPTHTVTLPLTLTLTLTLIRAERA